jgi:hypothetical protein
MDKFIVALARHEVARQKVDALSRRIGAAINRCPVVIKSNDWSISNAESAALWDDKSGKHKTHLWLAYTETTPSDCGYGMRLLDEDEQEEGLRPRNGGCRHCLRAWRLIRERRIERRELGYARLSLRALGRQAVKMTEVNRG